MLPLKHNWFPDVERASTFRLDRLELHQWKKSRQIPVRSYSNTASSISSRHCSFDEFTTSDVLSPLQLFTEFLFDRLQTPSLVHYFNPDEHLSTERISLELLSMKTNPTDVKQCSMRCLSRRLRVCIIRSIWLNINSICSNLFFHRKVIQGKHYLILIQQW